MPVNVSYPGVYIDEISGGARAIAGVPTSIAAFVGYTLRGPTGRARQIFSFADYERTFGGLHPESHVSYAVSHFFLNGGASAWIVRVAVDAEPASVMLLDRNANPTLLLTASSEGDWGNGLELVVDYDTSNPGSTFNLTVNEVREVNGRRSVRRSETHRNLSMNPQSANFVDAAVGADSELVVATAQGVAGGSAAVTSGPLVIQDANDLGDTTRRLAVTVDGGEVQEFDLFGAAEGGLADLDEVRDRINAGISGATASVDGDRIVVTSDTPGLTSSVSFRRASINSATTALRLNFTSGARETDGSEATRPVPTGTTGARAPDLSMSDNDSMTVELRTADGTLIDDSTTVPFAAAPTSLAAARTVIETRLRASTIPAISGSQVRVIDETLVLRAGGETPTHTLTFADDTGTAATGLGLTGGGVTVNLANYQLGVGPTEASQGAVTAGADGDPPTGSDISLLTGSPGDKTGMYALEDVDLFNILNFPNVSDVGILAEAVTYAEQRRSMLLIDIDASEDTLEEARLWINAPESSSLKHRNAVAYFPRVRLADPLQGGRLRTFPNSGLIAGLWARTDAARGVWKAPAGTEARLRGVQALDYVLSDPENGVLNPLGLNCLRTFPVYGTVCWGARTLVGADAFASEWKYVPVRRLALFIEESLYRGTQFVVFEPNDEPLWSQIRLSVGSFMHQLFRQGAFQGTTPQDAYLVRCDRSTTTQADIDLGIVNILVGFAPLKPAEFVILQIQQLAGQSQS